MVSWVYQSSLNWPSLCWFGDCVGLVNVNHRRDFECVHSLEEHQSMRGTTTAAIATSFFSLMGSFALMGGALAADLSSTKEPMPYMPPALIWSGCYVGANVGYGWQMDRSYDPNLALNAGSDTANGIVGGGQVGCDYQTGALVLGLQGSFDGASVSGSHFYLGGTPNDVLGFNTHWVATQTGRIGYAFLPQMLGYFKGGVAEANIGYTDVDPTIPYWGSGNATRVGWTIGVGAEYALTPNWSMFVEYDYAGFGSQNVTLAYASPNPFFASPYSYNERNNFQTLLVGVNYRFNWLTPPQPVVARY